MNCFEKTITQFIERCQLYYNYKVAVFINNQPDLKYVKNVIQQKAKECLLVSSNVIKIKESFIYIFYPDRKVDLMFHAILCEKSIPESIMRNKVKPRIDVYDNGNGNQMLNPYLIRFEIGGADDGENE